DLLSEYKNGEFYAPDLHIVGRLDLNSSGLLLLTNDGEWSRYLMSPENKVAKVYEVTVEKPISDECIHAFSDGMYFPFEDITTKPATLERMSDCVGRVTLEEGRYHQIKRMFGRFRNPVLKLHRISVGAFYLDNELAAGQAKNLVAVECIKIIKEEF
ncbi:MAG: pseudouridine synthase, partial [Cycloclasticus sp.]|nr:pseudouridine synthase [Cycloclasticus sp.]